MPRWLNVGCGTHRAPEPWLNIDVVRRDDVDPDLIVEYGKPLPYPDGTVERVYAGHVLEHMPWPETFGYVRELRRVLEPGGELFACGPDVYRTIERHKLGLEPQFMIHTVLEYHDQNAGFEKSDWPNARHWWNCTEARLLELIQSAGFAQVEAVPVPDVVIQEGWLDPWPNVGAAPWWCAVHAVA